MTKSRDDFSFDVINKSKLRAAYICSNPNCRTSTVAPSSTDDMLVQYCGKVAHITAAAPDGPRYDETIESKTRRSISNAIFLCSNCADLIDKNGGKDYPIELLKSWKREHNKWVLNNLNKKEGTSLNQISSTNQHGGIVAHTVNINTSPESKVDSRLVHDKEIYYRSLEIFDEDTMHNLFENLIGDGDCKIDSVIQLKNVLEFFKKAGNNFLDLTVNSSKDTFTNTIHPLTNYIHSHFDKWPYDQPDSNFTIQLMPQYLRDTRYRKMEQGDRDKWNKLFKKLEKLATSSLLAYRDFRLAVKKAYHI